MASLTALLAVAAFIVFSPKHESTEHNASMAPSSAPPTNDTSSSLTSVPKGNFVAEQYGAVICPDSKTFDAFDAASIRALSTNSSPDLAAIWRDAAEPNGCNYIRSGTSLVSEGEANNSGGGRPLAIVTATMPDGTAIRGVTFSSMLYSIPKGNVVAASVGAIICPDSKGIERYKNAMTAWSDNNESNMSAEEYGAAAKGSVEGLARSAGCNYVLPGTSLVSEGEVEGGHGYGANLNLIVMAKIPDGTTIKGITIPAMVTQNQQLPTSTPPHHENSAQQADAGAQATPPETPSYDPIPEGWNIKIGLPGTLSVGAEYCTQSGNCQYVGEGNVGLIQACQETPDAESCLKARVPVQVLASSPNGSVIVRLNGRNYGVGGVQWEHREPDGSSIGGPVSVIYQGASIPLRLGWQPSR